MLLFQNRLYVVTKICEHGVHLTNSYTHAKFERALLNINRYIHLFLNVILYSRVDDAKRCLMCIF